MFRTNKVLHIAADAKEDIAMALRSEGYNLRELFLKHNNPRYTISNNSELARLIDGTETNATSDVLEREMAILCRMRAVISDNVPKIIADVRNGKGIFSGYIMEHIAGEYFFSGTYLENSSNLTELENIVKELHKNKIAHGDLHRRNILVSPGNIVMLIDPYAFSDENPLTLFNKHSKMDMMHLENYEDDIQLQFISAQRK